MTLKEADEYAQKRLPVEFDGIEYRRITRTGYRYDENGRRIGFVELLDRGGGSVTFAEPDKVKLKEK